LCGKVDRIVNMKKQKKLVVGNWKMNPQTIEDAKQIILIVKRGTKNIRKTEVVICPPFVYLGSVSELKPHIFLGAQDAFYESLGSHTGEVSFSELLDFRVNFVILGHSEKRAKGETDEIINKKIKSVVNSKMTAIFCVGEKVRDQQGEYLAVIKKQIVYGLKDISKRFLENLVIAYEPVWAVDSKEAMRPQEIHETSIFIKKILRDMYGVSSSDVRILYGGDVTTDNVSDIMMDGHVNGVLIGRESLRPKDFVGIIKLVDSI